MLFSALPEPQGLYDPENEADSCGVAMVTDIQGRRSHAIVADGLVALEHLEHRGAAGAEPNSGDGAGILIQLPVELLRDVVDFELPAPAADGANTFAAGICFLPQDPVARAEARERVEAIAAEEGLEVLGWRAVPVDPDGAEIGATALGCMPYMSQLFVAAPGPTSAASISIGGSTRCASAPSGHGRLLPVAVQPDHGVQGHAHHNATAPILSGSARRTLRQRHRDRAQPLLHQHLPVLAAGPPVPVRRPQRRDQHRARQPQPHARPRSHAGQRADSRRPQPALADLHAGGLRLGVLRRGARAAAPRRPQPAARRADDDPRGVGEQHHHGPRRAGVLAVPRLADGAVGRPGLRHVHRRHPGRSGVGPQRITARTLVAHHRRPHHPRQRERCARRAVRRDRRQGPPAARQDVPDRHRRRPHRLRRRDQGSARATRAVRRMAARRPARPEDPARPSPSPAQPRVGGAQADLVRLHRGGPAHPAHPDGRLRRRTAGLDGHRHPDRGAVAAVPAALRLLRRTLRPGDQPAAWTPSAKRSSPRWPA